MKYLKIALAQLLLIPVFFIIGLFVLKGLYLLFFGDMVLSDFAIGCCLGLAVCEAADASRYFA